MKLDLNEIESTEEFDTLCNTVVQCRLCSRMNDSKRVLNRSSGLLNSEIMFIGEAPGRLGADSSGIPFHGDKAGHNFEEFLEFAGLDRSLIFVTNSVLCNPKDENGNNATPTKSEINNCSKHLSEQIKIINPKIVVTLGSVALESTRQVSNHNLTLKENVRTASSWFNRILIPLYHPGQRALLHRSLANQRSDYQFVSEQYRRGNNKSHNVKKNNSKVNHNVFPIILEMFFNLNSIDYFKLHKLFYLIEYNYYKEYKVRLTNAYIVRQKDGPYCTDLHIHKLKKAIPELEIKQKSGHLLLHYSKTLFRNEDQSIHNKVNELIKKIISKYGTLSSEQLKTKVYLTSPMRVFLKLEKEGKLNLYNVPIPFD